MSSFEPSFTVAGDVFATDHPQTRALHEPWLAAADTGLARP